MLRTARLVCERFTMEHVDELRAMDQEATVQWWLFRQSYTADETRERAARRVAFWDERGVGDYVVRALDGGETVGFAGFFPADEPDAIAIGYALHPPYWGRGYGTELARKLTATALDCGYRAIVATVRTENLASRHVLEKSGFVDTGPRPDGETVLYRYRG